MSSQVKVRCDIKTSSIKIDLISLLLLQTLGGVLMQGKVDNLADLSGTTTNNIKLNWIIFHDKQEINSFDIFRKL